MELLAAIEQLGAVRLLKASFYVYPAINALHIAAIGVVLTSVGLLDIRILGGLRTLPEGEFVAAMRRVAFIAFPIAVLSGLALFSVRATDYAGLPIFLAKMVLLLLAGLNLLLFFALSRSRTGARPSTGERASAVASILLWSGVLVCGRFIGFA